MYVGVMRGGKMSALEVGLEVRMCHKQNKPLGIEFSIQNTTPAVSKSCPKKGRNECVPLHRYLTIEVTISSN